MRFGNVIAPALVTIIAEVVCLHVDDEALDGLTPRPEALRLVGRMGGDWWVRTTDRFALPRPESADAAQLRTAGRGTI